MLRNPLLIAVAAAAALLATACGNVASSGSSDSAPPPGITKDQITIGATLPLTGTGVVDIVITDLGVFSIDKKGGTGMTLIELADGVTLDEIKAQTQADFKVDLNGKQSNAA